MDCEEGRRDGETEDCVCRDVGCVGVCEEVDCVDEYVKVEDEEADD